MSLLRLLAAPALRGAPAVLALAVAVPASTAAQEAVPGSTLPRVSVTFEESDVRQVARFFAAFADRSIVVGQGVEGTVTATIENQPWDEALAAILTAQGLRARELESGILVVEDPSAANADAVAALVTRVFRLSYVEAEELQPAVAGMLTERGSVSVVPALNALVVTDVPAVLGAVAGLLGR